MQFGAGRPDHLRHLSGFVRSEIVHNYNVAWLERGNEQLLDVGAEAFAVDRAIKDKRGRHSIMAEGAQEGQRIQDLSGITKGSANAIVEP